MTTATVTPPAPSLRERLAAAEEQLQDAQRAFGRVVLAGGDEQSAARRVSDARAVVEGLRHAQAEDVRDAEDAAAAEAERREATSRWTYVSWHAEYIKRIGPVLALRAELRAAEEDAMALCDLTPAVDPGWIRKEEIADGLEQFNLPRTATVAMHVHGANQHCGGHVFQARTEQLSAKDAADLEKRLAAQVAQAAKPLGKDAKPENLPWSGSSAA